MAKPGRDSREIIQVKPGEEKGHILPPIYPYTVIEPAWVGQIHVNRYAHIIKITFDCLGLIGPRRSCHDQQLELEATGVTRLSEQLLCFSRVIRAALIIRGIAPSG